MTSQEILSQCIVDGNLVKLPPHQLERKLYLEVAKKLQLIGGKWKGGKVMAFIFPQDPTELLAQIAGGEKRDLKKEFQFFATPDEIADHLVELSGLGIGDVTLEPSAGQGAIIQAINRRYPKLKVFCYELMDVNITFLKKLKTAIVIGEDFLAADGAIKYDRIIANPPFTKNQDIDHIRKMYDVLADNGTMVTIASKHWQHCNNKKEVVFRKWLESVNADIEEIESGAFKKSGTTISAVILKINKG